MKRLITLASLAGLAVGLAAVPTWGEGQQREQDRKRDGSCAAQKDGQQPPQDRQQKRLRKRDGSGCGQADCPRQGGQQRRRDGSCES